MTATDSTVLDEAYERFFLTGFEGDYGFANHGPMAAEVLVRLGHAEASPYGWTTTSVSTDWRRHQNPAGPSRPTRGGRRWVISPEQVTG